MKNFVFILKHNTMKLFNIFKKKKKIIPELNGIKLGLGWKRDLPDPRDLKFKIGVPVPMPELVDLRVKCPPVYDQTILGSCTANAMGGAFQFEQKAQGKKDFMPSRLFIYYNTRVIEGTVNSDAGATLRNTMKALVDSGTCPETKWVYDVYKFAQKPTFCCYQIAKNNQVLQYLRVTHSLFDIKQCLAEGHPVAFGMMLFESFMTQSVAESGIAIMPLPNEQAIGGHAVLAVGYDNAKNCLIVRNSWGEGWGDKGYFYLPYEYIITPNLAADFWTIRLVE